MQRAGVMATGVAVALVLAGSAARADECTPAICASVSPTCWLAYEKIMTRKGPDGIPSEARCKAMAEDDAPAFADWLKVQGLDARTAVCACAAAYWSLQGVAQGLPDMD